MPGEAAAIGYLVSTMGTAGRCDMLGIMRAMIIDRFGGPEELRLADVQRPEPGAGEVLVRIAFAGVNPADWKIREGWLKDFVPFRLPHILGFDGAGVVAALGKGVDGLRIGDRVVTASNQGKGAWGTYAEYAVSDLDRVVPLADSIDFRAAAALPTAGITSWEALFNVGGLRAGQQVLVNGGAGGMGSWCVQLAKMAGAAVAATCGPANVEYVRSLGADLPIDYRAQDVAAVVRRWAPEGVDLIVDTVGQGTLLQSVELVKPGGILACIGTLIAGEPQPDAARAGARGVCMMPTMSSFERQGAQLRALVEALQAGRIRAPAIEVLPLAAAADAQRRIQAGHVRGKIVLDVAGAASA
ncbi:MAG: 2-haloacrylate reductase [Steroidobacteraceae bacterium]|nr:2-haloacrylate reductase [Steroidobacteraceae bacterium]